jgi:hypothetical protein
VLQPEALVDQLQVGRHNAHGLARPSVRRTLDPRTRRPGTCARQRDDQPADLVLTNADADDPADHYPGLSLNTRQRYRFRLL